MSSADSSVVLQEIQRLLQPHPEVVGELKMGTDCLRTELGGKGFVIGARIESDPRAHPSIAHVHVIVESEHNDLNGHLDACVLGIDPNREAALKGAASSWFTAAAGPIFSLFHARPVLNAEHFSGTEAWGVRGAQGFVGPLVTRFGGDDSLGAQLLETPLFQFAPEIAPPGIIHLAKMTLNVVSKSWCRTLEVDGHLTTYRDTNWDARISPPKEMLASRFATFHYADQPKTISERQLLDDIIREYVKVFSHEQNLEKTYSKLVDSGRPEAIVDRVGHFLALAIGRALVTANLPIHHASTYHRVLLSGEMLRDIPLMSEPAFARGLMLVDELSQSQLEAVKRLALSSAEVNAVNNLLNSGGELEDCKGSPFIIPDLGTMNEAFERALSIYFSQTPDMSSGLSNAAKKPWWKFW